MTDWSAGEYELTADRLEPAARHVVSRLRLEPGACVADVACGTGNAAIAAARAGASVMGFDVAERLLSVARDRAAVDGLDARFEVGDATALPADDEAFDAAVSIFGVIFADAARAAAELRRITKPGGRIVVTAWTAEGPTAAGMRVVAEALGSPPAKRVWTDPEALRALFPGAAVTVDEQELRFTAPSLDAYLDEHAVRHPMWLDLLPALEAKGVADDTLAAVRDVYAAANEDPSGFSLPAPYAVVVADLAPRDA